MELLASHTVLSEGDDTRSCTHQVLQFFEQTSLVCYDKIVVDQVMGAASDTSFGSVLEAAIERNRRTLERFVSELGTTGFSRRTDLLSLHQGYHSKILHIIAHFLDGFIGIDSAFYNMVDDSHWVPDETGRRIAEEPERFSLLFLKCYSLTPREASLLHA